MRGAIPLWSALAVATLAATSLPVAAQTAAAETAVVERTLLKAAPGKRDALARFIVANWFAMDAVAQKEGLFTFYRLYENVEGPSPSAPEWDFAVAVGYRTALGYAEPRVQTRFAEIRAAHTPILIEGQSLSALGRIVRTERYRPREGSQ